MSKLKVNDVVAFKCLESTGIGGYKLGELGVVVGVDATLNRVSSNIESSVSIDRSAFGGFIVQDDDVVKIGVL